MDKTRQLKRSPQNLRARVLVDIPQTVQFAILSAKNLEPPPTRWCFAPAPINAFAVFKFRKIQGRSSVEHRTTHPIWNMKMVEIGTVRPDVDEEIEITVYHRNKVNSNSVLATASFPVHRLIEAGPGNHQRWVPLRSERNGKGVDPPLLLIKYNNFPQA